MERRDPQGVPRYPTFYVRHSLDTLPFFAAKGQKTIVTAVTATEPEKTMFSASQVVPELPLDKSRNRMLVELFLKSAPTIFTRLHSQKNTARFMHVPQVSTNRVYTKTLLDGLRSESTDG